MNEHEPIEQRKARLEKATKLRSMVDSPGWKDVFVPYIEGEIERFRKRILTEDFPDLTSLKVTQEKLRYLEHMLDWPQAQIKTADKIISEENKKANVRSQTT